MKASKQAFSFLGVYTNIPYLLTRNSCVIYVDQARCVIARPTLGLMPYCALRNPGGTVVGVVGVEPKHEHHDKKRAG